MERMIRVVQRKWNYRALLFFICYMLFSPTGAQNGAQTPTIGELFKQMPDSLMPYLTKNNRLDMMDFMDAHMKAEVTNQLDGKSEMTALTADSLTIQMSDALQVDMKLVAGNDSRVASMLQEGYDSLVVCVQNTYKISERQIEKTIRLFSTTWRPLSLPQTVCSTLLKRDDDLFKGGE